MLLIPFFSSAPFSQETLPTTFFPQRSIFTVNSPHLFFLTSLHFHRKCFPPCNLKPRPKIRFPFHTSAWKMTSLMLITSSHITHTHTHTALKGELKQAGLKKTRRKNGPVFPSAGATGQVYEYLYPKRSAVLLGTRVSQGAATALHSSSVVEQNLLASGAYCHTHFGLVHDISDWDYCWAQNGSTRGHVFCKFQMLILNRSRSWVKQQLLCSLFPLPFLWIGSTALLRFNSPLRTHKTTDGAFTLQLPFKQT